jgi:DNA-binding response OmpR family regulator
MMFLNTFIFEDYMPKIAVIDDDPDIVQATTMLLQAKKYEVVSSGNIDDGLILVKNEKPDLIILDVMLQEPDDGFYMAIKLRKIGINTPIIMLTSVSKALGFDFGEGENLPVDEFLEKPVPPSVLLEKVVQHLQKTEG